MTCCDPSGTSILQNIYNTQISTQIYLASLRQMWIDASFDVDVAFFQVPANFDTDPGDVGAEVDDRNRALCLAVESFIDELFNQGVAWIESIAVDIAAIGIGAMTIPSVPTWIVGAALTTAGLSLSEAHGELTNEAYREYIACAMFEELKGQSTDLRAAFAQSLDNLPVRPPPPETAPEDIARDIIETWARSQVNDLDTYLSFVNGLDRAMTTANVLTDEDCGCTEEGTWCWEIDFTATDGGFVDTGICGDFGTWVDGVGWISQASGPSQSLCIHNFRGDFNITNASMTVWTNEVLSGPGSGRPIVGRRAAAVIFTEWGSQAAGEQTTIWEGDETIDQLVLNPSGQGPTEGNIILTHAIFRGMGSNPFGEDNCE